MAKKEDEPIKPFEKNGKTDSVNMEEVEQNRPKTFGDLQEEADLADARNPEILKYIDEAIRNQLIEEKRLKKEKKQKKKKEEVKKKEKDFRRPFDSDSDSDSDEEVKFSEWKRMIERQKMERKEKRKKEKEKKKIEKMLEEHTPVDFVSVRPGTGKEKFVYLEGQTAIQLANAIFGPFGWKSKITSINNNFVDKVKDGWLVCTTAVVEVSVTGYDGSHEEIGIGRGWMKDKVQALNLAQKSAVTGALKRALRQFGNLLGNSLYDTFHINKLDTNKAKFPDRITHDYIRDLFKEDNDITLSSDDEKLPKNPDKKELEEKTENKPVKKQARPVEIEPEKPERKEDEEKREDEVEENASEINEDDIAKFF